jgi:hypothetical protein
MTHDAQISFHDGENAAFKLSKTDGTVNGVAGVRLTITDYHGNTRTMILMRPHHLQSLRDEIARFFQCGDGPEFEPVGKDVRLKTLTCKFCGTAGLRPVLTGTGLYLTLPTHPDPTFSTLACVKSGSFYVYDFESQ